jgi:threonine synthase
LAGIVPTRVQSRQETTNALQYVSTRGRAPSLSFEAAMLAGLAGDGGLYVPAEWPPLTPEMLQGLAGKPYREVAFQVMWPFVDGFTEARFRALIDAAYAGFAHAEVAPLVQVGPGHFLLELFHGPTLAFKDVALQLLGRMFDEVLSRRGERVTVVGATSGDTGAAAIEACRDRAAIEIFVLHPEGRVSEAQRRQMTTVDAANVHNIAIRGTFDDCQALLKRMFNDRAFRDELHLSAVNSINWARVMAQIVYYVYAAVQLGAPERRVRFVVPTGNFGDIYAGYAAARMGLPVERLVVATNRNDLLHRFFTTGEYRRGEVVATQSPSMDIQVASNFERLLFDLCDRDGAEVAALMQRFEREGRFLLGGNRMAKARALFLSASVDEAGTSETIRRIAAETGRLIDPHTAVGVAAAMATGRAGVPTVTLATADAAKFADAVGRAAGRRPTLPPRLADLFERQERCAVLANDLATVEAHIRAEAGRARPRQGSTAA